MMLLKMIKKTLLFVVKKHEVPSVETLFHRIGAPLFRCSYPVKQCFLQIGPLFRRIGPRVSPDRTFSKTNAPNQTKHSVWALNVHAKWCAGPEGVLESGTHAGSVPCGCGALFGAATFSLKWKKSVAATLLETPSFTTVRRGHRCRWDTPSVLRVCR